MKKIINIAMLCLLCFGFLYSEVYQNTPPVRKIVMRDYVENGRVNALSKNNEQNVNMLIQLDLVNDSLLTLVNNAINGLEFFAGPSSYQRILNYSQFSNIQNILTDENYRIISNNYVATDSRDYWSETQGGGTYIGASGDVDPSCMCLDASNCLVIGFNDDWWDPLDYYGEAWWGFNPPENDGLIEVRVSVKGSQCDDLPLWSETTVSMRNSSCGWSDDWEATLSIENTVNGPYVLPENMLDNIFCEGSFQPIIGSEDNYNVEWVKLEFIYDCNVSNPPTTFQASDSEFCDYVSLQWSSDSEASGVIITRDGEQIADVGTNITAYDDYYAQDGQSHEYCVYTYNNCGNSGMLCNPGSTQGVSNSPTNVEASNDLSGEIMVTWDATENTSSYKIYRDTFLLGMQTADSPTIFVDQFVENGFEYLYCVESVNDCGNSELACDVGLSQFGNLGDLNNDEIIDVIDIVLMVNIITETHTPSEYEIWAGDLNSDGSLNIQDIILLVQVIIN